MDRSWFGLAALLLGVAALACLLALAALVVAGHGLADLPSPTLGLVAMAGVFLVGWATTLALARRPAGAPDPHP